MLLGREVMCQEYSQCYDDINICLWMDGSKMEQHEAQAACQRQDNSFLPRITNSDAQSKLAEFRTGAQRSNLIGNDGFWIDVRQGDEGFHWIDGSPLAGLFAHVSG